jgi:hypothetical protein
MTARRSDTKCSFCGECFGYPYLEWDDLFICGPCCKRWKKGLMADLAHCAAVQELKDIGYPGETLVRMSEKDAERYERWPEEAGQMIMEMERHKDMERAWRNEEPPRYGLLHKVK